MKTPTALTECIKEIDDQIEFSIKFNYSDETIEVLKIIRATLTSKLPKEREDLEKSFKSGYFGNDIEINVSALFENNFTQE